jgi:predicted oxidoreductase|tara:strand:- start:137 stop:433 length:297 start_codon:yes stop_codon:yes gene_type:complete
MQEFGGNVAPLSVVGMFLNYTGNHILHYISTVMRRKVFYPSHRVTGIQLLQNGEVLVSTVRKQCVVTKNEKNGHTVFSEQETQVSFRAKAVVVGNGGY